MRWNQSNEKRGCSFCSLCSFSLLSSGTSSQELPHKLGRRRRLRVPSKLHLRIPRQLPHSWRKVTDSSCLFHIPTADSSRQVRASKRETRCDLQIILPTRCGLRRLLLASLGSTPANLIAEGLRSILAGHSIRANSGSSLLRRAARGGFKIISTKTTRQPSAWNEKVSFRLNYYVSPATHTCGDENSDFEHAVTNCSDMDRPC